jgi:hypothetical protein
VKYSEVEYSEVLSNRVPNIIRIRIDHVRFRAYIAVWFITFCYILLVTFCINVRFANQKFGEFKAQGDYFDGDG